MYPSTGGLVRTARIGLLRTVLNKVRRTGSLPAYRDLAGTVCGSLSKVEHSPSLISLSLYQGSPYRSIPAYRDLAGMVRAVRISVNHRTGTYRPYRAVQGGTENLGLY
ncbi:hypothetical protein GW17_00015827 [Ensete ventricosum]|nr:hypothetical protein GW17_00015827 [Ensete ventricosum]